MKYDVFISYSRKDTEVAESLCKALDKAGVNYWIDRNIHGSANFLSEITRYIRDCKVVLFIASSNSAASTWTQKEILYALKFKKHIVPYRIGDFSFDDNAELDFVFMNVQWIETEGAVISALKELDCCNKSEKNTQAAPTTPAVSQTSTPAQATQTATAEQGHEKAKNQLNSISGNNNTAKTYKVGDYYNANGKEGVVFDVWDGGKHGKIVSLDEASLLWCTQQQRKIAVGTTSQTDGKANTDAVMARMDSAEYPAFVWCRDKGRDWYLPSVEELNLILMNEGVYDAVNRTLGNRNATKLINREKWDGVYWSSTERNAYCAVYVAIRSSGSQDPSKYSYKQVRAVSTF